MVCGITASAPPVVPRGGASSGSSTSSTNGGGDRDDNNVPLVGLGPDPFVSAAPLIVAAVCSDGVILAALHTIFADEPLLLLSSSSSSSASAKEKEDDNEDSHDDDDIKKNQSDTKTTTTTTVIKDLPRGYRGPFRIHSIDGYGTALTSTGWRADTHIMTDYSRLVAAEELEIYGSPTTIPGKQYGQVLSNDISSWMAQCAISDQTRSLSCVGLLATCCGRRRGSSNNNRNNDDALGGGYLWLIDATGSYRVRAHAVGANAGYVNSKLETIDWTQYNKEEAARNIVKLLSEELLDNDRIPSEACIELAYISSSSSGGNDEKSSTTATTEKRRLERLFTSRLFGIAAPRAS